ncbi:hypothetical protein HK101_011801, partial [Irineochytrium annulatum]
MLPATLLPDQRAAAVLLPYGATVADLKASLERFYPTGPKVLDQRLIFSGSLLADGSLSLLADVFRKCDASMPQTLHLVLKAGPALDSAWSPSAVASSNGADAGLRLRKPAVVEPTVIVPAASSSAPLSSTLPINSFASNLMLQSQMAFMLSTQQHPPAVPPPVQVVVINGIPYALQMNPQAMQQLALGSLFHTGIPPLPSGPLPQPQLPHPAVAPEDIPVVAAVAPAAAPVNNIAPQPPQPPAAPAMAAGGGGALGFMQQDNDDEFNEGIRNAPQNPLWLLMKLAFMVWLFAQNASRTRVILLNVLALVIFLVQTGRLTLRWPFRVNAAAVPAPVVNPIVPAPAPAAQDAPFEDVLPPVVKEGSDPTPPPTSTVTDEAASAVAVQPEIRPVNLLQEINALVYTFFTSLVPDAQEAV